MNGIERRGQLIVLGMSVLAVMLTGCHSVGPRGLEGTHSLYNQAIVTSLNEQFLHNLVRLRYRDTPYFLEIASVTASLKLEASVGMGSELSTGGGAELFMPRVGMGYSTTPTISYAPLQGEDFLKNVLTPISLDSLFILTESGWSSKRVLGLCAESFNHLQNAPSASGPTPSGPPPGHREFVRLLELFESVRNRDLMQPKLDEGGTGLFIRLGGRGEDEGTVEEIKELLSLEQELSNYKVNSSYVLDASDTIAIRTRSIMSMLFYLSHTVEAPEDHEKAGFVTVTRNPDGSRFDWNSTPGGRLFNVRSSEQRPSSAYLAIPYRGYWFYIEDSDLESKSTFMLISQLFSLQAGNVKSSGPALTIPVSR